MIRRAVARGLTATLLAALALLCWARGGAVARELSASANSISLRYAGEILPGDVVDAMVEEEEKTAFAAWRQRPGQRVENEELGRSHTAAVVEAAGEAGLILPSGALLAGRYPTTSGRTTCAVDDHTAQALWGSVQVEGKVLRLGGRDYEVTGVFSSPKDTVLLQVPPSSGGFSALDVAAPATGLDSAEGLISRYGLPGADYIRNNRQSAGLLEQLAPLPLLVPCAALLWALLRRGLWGFSPFLRWLVGLPLFALGLWLACRCVGFAPGLSLYLPAQFADFAHWQRLWASFTQAMGQRQLLAAGPDSPLYRAQYAAAGWIAGSCALFATAARVVGGIGKQGGVDTRRPLAEAPPKEALRGSPPDAVCDK